MLRHLTISNIALIDKLSLDFEEGFSALTGETGAGKSILIEAVGLALGERAYRESIRTGAQKGAVEALFTVKEGTPAAEYLLDQELYDGEEVVLYRELYASGKSVCRINGTLVSAAELKTVGDMLVDMHGQHAHQSLLNEKTHLGLLDAFASSDGDGLLTRMLEERKAALEARSAREKLQNSLKERARRLDVIAYELKEIDGASLEPGEEEQLELKKKQLQNFAAIEENLQAAYDALYEEQGALGQIAEAKRCLGALGEYGEEYQAAARQTEEAYYTLSANSKTTTVNFENAKTGSTVSRITLQTNVGATKAKINQVALIKSDNSEVKLSPTTAWGCTLSTESTPVSGIHELHYTPQTDNRIYNLQGQQIAQPRRGIYIQNGKKFIAK